MARHDAIIIGGGLNGLTAAAYLARAGASVLVLERNAALGGASANYEIAPGFRMPHYSLGTSQVPAHVISDLALTDYGLRLFRVDGGVTLFPDGGYLANYRDGTMQRRELARFSPKDADAWTRYRRDMLRAAKSLRVAAARPAADPARCSWSALRGKASAPHAAPVNEFHDLLPIWNASCADLLGGYFESGIVKSHLASAALAGTALGPYAPTSARFLLRDFMDDTAGANAGAPASVIPLGGPEAVAIALAACVFAHGGQIRNEAEVTKILLHGNKAHGVMLADGEACYAPAIISDLDLQQTFLTLFPWQELPDGLVDHVRSLRVQGVTAKVNLALEGMPRFEAIPADCPARLGGVRLGFTLPELDRACDDWRGGFLPRSLLIETLMPSLVDRRLAPDGCHVMSVQVHYVPQAPNDGPWTAERKSALGKTVISQLAEKCPNLPDLIRAVDILVPGEIASEVGHTAGSFAQGEIPLEQMFAGHPFAGLAGYETPIRNFYLCSGALAPGGAGVAAQVAKALRRREHAS